MEKKDGLHFSVDGISFVPLCSIDKEKYQVYVKVPGKFEKMMGKTNKILLKRIGTAAIYVKKSQKKDKKDLSF